MSSAAPAAASCASTSATSSPGRAVDLVIVNGENAAGGFGLTPPIADEFFDLGVDVITTGNHVWDKNEIIDYFNPSLPTAYIRRAASSGPPTMRRARPASESTRARSRSGHSLRRRQSPGPRLHAHHRRPLPHRRQACSPDHRQGHRRRHPRRSHLGKSCPRLVSRWPRHRRHRHPHPHSHRRRRACSPAAPPTRPTSA